MEEIPIPPEILDHARGALMFDLSEVTHSVSGIAAYRCKLYRALLDQGLATYSVAERHTRIPSRRAVPVLAHDSFLQDR
jgi:hypothetical protein